MQQKTYPRGTTVTAIPAPDDDLHPPSPLGIRAHVLVSSPVVRRCIGRRLQRFEVPILAPLILLQTIRGHGGDTANLGPRGSVARKLALD